MVNIRKAQSEREQQYFLQAHAPNIVKISGDIPGHLDRYEDADRSRIRILQTQRLQIEPNEALLKKLLKKKKALMKGKGKDRKRVNLKDELAKINRELKIMRQGQFRRNPEDPVRVYQPGAVVPVPAGVVAPAGAVAPHAGGAVGGVGGGGAVGAAVPPVAHAAVGAAAIPAVHPGLVADIGAIRGEMARVRQDIAAIPPGETPAERQQRINRDQQRYDGLVDRLDAALDDIDAVRRNVNQADIDHAARVAQLGQDVAASTATIGGEIVASDLRVRRGLAGIDERLGGVAEQQQALEDRYGGLEGRFDGLAGNIETSLAESRQRGLGHQEGLDNLRLAQAELREAFVEQMAEMGERVDAGNRSHATAVRQVGRRIGALDTSLTDETQVNRDRERQRQADHAVLLDRLGNHDSHIDEFRRYNASVEELIRVDRERAEIAERRLADGDSGFTGEQVGYLERHGEAILARLNAIADESERRDGDSQAAFENIREELAALGGQVAAGQTPAQLAQNIRAQLNDPRLAQIDPLQRVTEDDDAGPPAPEPEPEGGGGGVIDLRDSGFQEPPGTQSPEDARASIFEGTGGLDFDGKHPPKPTDDGGGKVSGDTDEGLTDKETGRGEGPAGLEMPSDEDDDDYDDYSTDEEGGKKEVSFKTTDKVQEIPAREDESDEGSSGRDDDDSDEDPFKEDDFREDPKPVDLHAEGTDEFTYGTADDVLRSRELWDRAQPDLGQEAGMRGRRSDSHNESRMRYRVRNIHPLKELHGILTDETADVAGATSKGQIRLKTGGGTDGRGHRVEWESLNRNIQEGRVLFEGEESAREQRAREKEEGPQAAPEEEAGGSPGQAGRPRIAGPPKTTGPAPPPRAPETTAREDLLIKTIARQRQERGKLSRELTAATQSPKGGGRSTRAIEADLRFKDKDIERLQGELEREQWTKANMPGRR